MTVRMIITQVVMAAVFMPMNAAFAQFGVIDQPLDVQNIQESYISQQPWYHQQTYTYQSQYGNNNIAVIDMDQAVLNKAFQDQMGENNASLIDQVGEKHLAIQIQQGSDNDGAGFSRPYGAEIYQSDGSWLKSLQVQSGSENYAYSSQSGLIVFGSQNQFGDGNFASLVQDGDHLYAYCEQNGNNNIITSTQTGSKLFMIIEQSGNGFSSVNVNQTDATPYIEIRQH